MITDNKPDFFLPGDRVKFCGEPVPYVERWRYTSNPWWQGSFRRGTGPEALHTVRAVSQDPATGEQRIHLVGCFGVAVEGDQEPGFSARSLKRVASGKPVAQLDGDDMIQIPVSVSARIAKDLESFQLFPQVEAQHLWEDEEHLQVVCRRFLSTFRQSKSIKDAGACVKAEIEAYGSVVLEVPISALGWQDLDGVCNHLGILPERWLQGVLFNLAHRAKKMREIYLGRLRTEEKKRNKKQK